MNVKIAGSGSKGNCAVIDDYIIIDAGCNVDVHGKVLLLSHRHNDHIKYVDKFAACITFANKDTCAAVQSKNPYIILNECRAGQPIIAGNDSLTYNVTPVAMQHDVPCLAWYITRRDIESNKQSTIFFGTDFSAFLDKTDEGYFIDCLRNKSIEAIYIECNNTLDPTCFDDVYFPLSNLPKDEFHRRRSYQTHCNAGYLIELFLRAGYSAQNRCKIPTTLLHKSSTYYGYSDKALNTLSDIATITNV